MYVADCEQYCYFRPNCLQKRRRREAHSDSDFIYISQSISIDHKETNIYIKFYIMYCDRLIINIRIISNKNYNLYWKRNASILFAL